MTLGMTPFTLFHVVISLVGIVTGLVVMSGMLTQKPLDGWVAVFLATTIGTSVTGFLFPFVQFLPSHGVGIISLLILPVAVAGRYFFHLKGAWSWLYTVSSVTALYLNVFVLIVQLFLKVPALRALAPTQTEPTFALAQGLNLILFVWLGVVVTLRAKRAALKVPATAQYHVSS
jgi:hypothetical protein